MGISVILGTNGFIMEEMGFKDTVCSEPLTAAGSDGVQCSKALEVVPTCTVSFRTGLLCALTLYVSFWLCLYS